MFFYREGEATVNSKMDCPPTYSPGHFTILLSYVFKLVLPIQEYFHNKEIVKASDWTLGIMHCGSYWHEATSLDLRWRGIGVEYHSFVLCAGSLR